MTYYKEERKGKWRFKYRIVMNGHGEFRLERKRLGWFQSWGYLGWDRRYEDGNKNKVWEEKADLRYLDWDGYYQVLFSDIRAAVATLVAIQEELEEEIKHYRRSTDWSVITEG